MKQGHVFFIVGVTGSGKGTLRKNLEKKRIKNLEFLKSYVTRDLRPGEVNGDMYHFISQEDFQMGIQKGEFLEYELVHKVAYYGTKKSEVEQGIAAGKILMKEIDTKGLKQLAEKHPKLREQYTSFFLDIPDDILRERFFSRNPEASEIDFQNRLESAIFEREHADEFCDYLIDASQSPESVLEEVLAIIEFS